MKRVRAWWHGLSLRERVLFLVAMALLMLPAGWIIVSKLRRSGQLATDDADWKYVEVRRFFAFLEHSIDPSSRWVVFDPNGQLVHPTRLWPFCRKVSSKVGRR